MTVKGLTEVICKMYRELPSSHQYRSNMDYLYRIPPGDLKAALDQGFNAENSAEGGDTLFSYTVLDKANYLRGRLGDEADSYLRTAMERCAKNEGITRLLRQSITSPDGVPKALKATAPLAEAFGTEDAGIKRIVENMGPECKATIRQWMEKDFIRNYNDGYEVIGGGTCKGHQVLGNAQVLHAILGDEALPFIEQAVRYDLDPRGHLGINKKDTSPFCYGSVDHRGLVQQLTGIDALYSLPKLRKILGDEKLRGMLDPFLKKIENNHCYHSGYLTSSQTLDNYEMIARNLQGLFSEQETVTFLQKAIEASWENPEKWSMTGRSDWWGLVRSQMEEQKAALDVGDQSEEKRYAVNCVCEAVKKFDEKVQMAGSQQTTGPKIENEPEREV